MVRTSSVGQARRAAILRLGDLVVPATGGALFEHEGLPQLVAIFGMEPVEHEGVAHPRLVAEAACVRLEERVVAGGEKAAQPDLLVDHGVEPPVDGALQLVAEVVLGLERGQRANRLHAHRGRDRHGQRQERHRGQSPDSSHRDAAPRTSHRAGNIGATTYNLSG